MSNNNGNKTKENTTASPDSADNASEEELVDQTLDGMQETERCLALSDLELIAEIWNDDQLSLDPRVYELMTRLYPDWPNEDYRSLPRLPRFIAISVPYQVAYDVANFSKCRCSDSSDKNTATISKPCVFCATRISLFRATHDPAYSPADDQQ